MNRREMMKALGGGGVGALALMPLLGNSQELLDGSASAAAMRELQELLARKDAEFSGPGWRLSTADERAEARLMLLQSVHHAVEARLSVDPQRPVFKRYVTPEKKLLGDNPDAIYYTALIDPAGTYRIRGNVSGATYTSFTVERRPGQGLGATLNDTEFTVDAQGNFEIIASPVKPAAGDWLRLESGADSITTRHYFEQVEKIAARRNFDIPLTIEPLGPQAAPPVPGDEELAQRIAAATRWLDVNVAPPAAERSPHWVSRVPNRFNPPKRDDSNQSVSLAAKDNVYAMAPWFLREDQALLITGRFPRCRFANVVLWNRFMQTLNYTHRQTSLNRMQTVLEADGSFRMIVAAKDPGVPNWLDTEGRHSGIMFWRFQLPEEDIAPLHTQVIQLSTLHYG